MELNPASISRYKKELTFLLQRMEYFEKNKCYGKIIFEFENGSITFKRVNEDIKNEIINQSPAKIPPNNNNEYNQVKKELMKKAFKPISKETDSINNLILDAYKETII